MDTAVSGFFTVLLHSLTYDPGSVTNTAAERHVWIYVQLILPPEQPLKHIWFSADDDNMITKTLSISAQSNGQALSLEYNQKSRAVPLTSNTMQELMQTDLVLSLYSGTSRTRTTDLLLSKTIVPLRRKLLNETKETHSAKFLLPEETFFIEFDIQRDVALADFLLGSRVLEIRSPRVLNLPPEWTFPDCKSDQEALEFCASVDRNSANYELEFSFPRLGSTDSVGEEERAVSPYEFIILPMKGGKVHYEPALIENDAELLRAGDDQEKEQLGLTLSGVWSVRFLSPVNVVVMTYLKISVERLLEFLMVEKFVSGTLRRFSTHNTKTKTIDTVTAELRLPMDGLLTPGIAQIDPMASLRAILPVSRDLLEKELPNATSQTALTDYDKTLQHAATLTAKLTTAGTYVRITAEVLPTPLALQPPRALEAPSKSIEELISPRDWNAETEKRRNVRGDLQTELRLIVSSFLREYEDAFRINGDKKEDDTTDVPVGRNEKKRLLIYRLNTQGIYHSFTEVLKKRIIPFIRDFLAGNEEDNDVYGQTHLNEKTVEYKKKEHFGDLYALIMQEVNTILHETFYSDTITALEKNTAERHSTVNEFQSVLDVLRLKALENLVSGDFEKCEMLHLDRIEYAEEHVANMYGSGKTQKPAEMDTTFASQQLVGVWYDYACFCLAQSKLEKAGAALQQCLRYDTHAIQALIALVALQCDLREFARTESFVKNAVVEAETSAKNGCVNAIEHGALAHALLAFFYSQCKGKDQTGNLSQFELLKAQHMLQNRKDVTCASAVWIYLAEYANDCKLWGLTKDALQLAETHLKHRDIISNELRVMKRTMEAELVLQDGTGGDDARAIKLLQEALEIDSSHPFAWFMLGKVYLRQDSQTKTAIECLQRALEHRELICADALRLELYLRLGLALLHSTQFEMAETTFLLACDEFHVASSWLGVGIACLRLERWERAQMALAEANRLDPSNADVWGYQALFMLSAHTLVSASDEANAQLFLSQALRHNLSNPALLRELSNAFVAIDRLESAEKLLRRSLICQDSSLTRKTLADVLAAQNCADDALRHYIESLNMAEGIEERCALLEQCAKLLTTLGRPEEANEYRIMVKQFHTDSG